MIFFLCALIPVGGMAVIAYQHVSQQLDEQFHSRMKRSVKTYSLLFYERFLILETELTMAASHLSKNREKVAQSMENRYLKRLQKRFSAMAVFNKNGHSRALIGQMTEAESLNKKMSNHLKTGDSLVKIIHNSMGQADLVMIVLLDPQKPGAGFLAAKINPDYLLALDREFHLPRDVDLLIRDESQNIIYRSIQENKPILNRISQNIVGRDTGNFEFELEDDVYLASYRWIFLEPKFLFPGFNIMFIQSKTNAFLQMVEFKKIFPQVLILSLLVVIILSIYFIRKNLEPLKLLKAGTHQIAKNNFSYRVEIGSQDEFQELGEAFNQMSTQLKDQFNTLETSAQITRAVLSSLERQSILNTVLSHMKGCFNCQEIGIGLINQKQPGTIQCYLAGNQKENSIRKFDRKLLPTDLLRLQNNPDFLVIEQNQELPDYLAIMKSEGISVYLVLPILLDGNLSAVLTLAYRSSKTLKDDRPRGRQMADQVAVALANSCLMEQLNRLNWGTLNALARTVDAKSSWTAGHSGRVTQLALRLGDTLRLTPKDRDLLHRAALLHDIGKIAIPVAILDKPGKLSEQEYDTIKTHPRAGARILEPIEEYSSLIPMVLQHHERFDGKGYPDGLSGNSIQLGARILAVADVFDAMKSDRPYRDGMPLEKVMGIIQEESGRQFDPNVVEALFEVIYSKATKAA